jgi:hypothetical protein
MTVRIGVIALGSAWRHSAARLDQRRTGDAGEDRRLDDAERDRRQDQRGERAAETGAPAGKAAGRRDAPVDRKKQNEKDREPEIRHREADLAGDHHRRVAEFAAAIGGVDAGDQRNRSGDRHRQQGERRADRQPRSDQRRDRRIISVGKAEVAGERAGRPMPVTHGEGLIEAELVGERGHRLGRRAGAQHGLRGVAGQDLDHAEHDERRDGEGHEENEKPLKRVAEQ